MYWCLLLLPVLAKVRLSDAVQKPAEAIENHDKRLMMRREVRQVDGIEASTEAPEPGAYKKLLMRRVEKGASYSNEVNSRHAWGFDETGDVIDDVSKANAAAKKPAAIQRTSARAITENLLNPPLRQNMKHVDDAKRPRTLGSDATGDTADSDARKSCHKVKGDFTRSLCEQLIGEAKRVFATASKKVLADEATKKSAPVQQSHDFTGKPSSAAPAYLLKIIVITLSILSAVVLFMLYRECQQQGGQSHVIFKEVPSSAGSTDTRTCCQEEGGSGDADGAVAGSTAVSCPTSYVAKSGVSNTCCHGDAGYSLSYDDACDSGSDDDTFDGPISAQFRGMEVQS